MFDYPALAGAPLLIRRHFGCGSSRGTRAWALLDSASLAVIRQLFRHRRGNASERLLAVVLSQAQVTVLAVAATHPIHVDLEAQTVTTPFQDRFAFQIDPFRKHCLLGGLDEVGLTLERDAAIAQYEARHARDMPWLAHPNGVPAR